MAGDPSSNEATFTFLIPDRSRERVLLIDDGDGVWRLPSVSGRRGWISATVHELSILVAEHLGLRGQVIRSLGPQRDRGLCELELDGEPDNVPPAMRWFEIDDVPALAGTSENERSAVLALTVEPDQRRAPWERPGWHDAPSAWFTEVLEARGIHVEDRPTVVKGAWPASCVMRVMGDGRAWYCKAVGTKPPAESAVLPLLAARFPKSVPEVLGVDEQRRWMVLADFGPTMADDDHDGMAAALVSFARLQIAAAPDLQPFIDAGCPDDRAGALVESLSDLRHRHPRLAAGPLLDELLAAVAHEYWELERGPVPRSIVHQDLRNANIAVGPPGPVFYDWSDTVIAHPFFSAVRFIEFVEDDEGTVSFADAAPADPLRTRLRDAYLAPWATRHGWDTVRQAFSTAWRLQGAFQAVRWDREMAHADPDGMWARWLPNAVVGCCETAHGVLTSRP